MSDLQNKLVFSESPLVELGSNFFINVPVILQYKDTPLISVRVRLMLVSLPASLSITTMEHTWPRLKELSSTLLKKAERQE